MTTLWIEKYEPKTLDEMVLHPRTRMKLQNVMRDCQNAILYGIPGCGKTTFTKIFLRKMENITIQGNDGIEVIKDKVLLFSGGGNLNSFFESDSPQPAIKYVIINEAEGLGKASQTEFRTIIENHVKLTRFAFITNEIDKLQDQIRSRCVEVEFEKAQPKDVVAFVRKILVAEGVSDNHVGDRVNQIWQLYPGDIRRVVKEIQFSVVDGKII